MSKTEASPATTNKAINHPLRDRVFANKAPRAAKLQLAMIIAKPVENGSGSAGMPSARASTTRHAALNKANRTPVQKCPAVAAAIMPTPIRPKVNIGPLTETRGEEAVDSTTITRTGAATPVRNAVPQARLFGFRSSIDVNSLMETMLTEASGIVDTLRFSRLSAKSETNGQDQSATERVFA